MPRSLRCYDGAIRLYAPGCSANDVPQQHPYWLPDDAAKLGPHRFARLLQDQCINRQPHHPRRRMFTETRDYIERRYVEDQSESCNNPNRTAPILGKNGSLPLRRYWMRQTTRPTPTGQPAPAAAGNAPPASVPEAVNQAQTLPGLRFLPNAIETANSPYTLQFDHRANTFYRSFQALSQCAAARAQGPLGMPAADWIKRQGIEYAPNESDETMHRNRGRLAGERAFYDPKTSRAVPMPAHLKLFGPQIRIHLSWSDPESAWLIGYIGEHLPTASDPH